MFNIKNYLEEINCPNCSLNSYEIIKRSNYSQVKKLRYDFSIICSTLCDKIKSIKETLKNIEPKNAS